MVSEDRTSGAPADSRPDPIRFRLRAGLYGREEEKRLLQGLVDRSAGGPGQTVFVSGPAGVGKTALIQSTAARALDLGGQFAFGKYDQFHISLPYRA